MIRPSALALVSPIVIGFMFWILGYYTGYLFLGVNIMASMLMLVTVSDILLALSLNTVGDASDNMKKYIKKGALGDTVGDYGSQQDLKIVWMGDLCISHVLIHCQGRPSNKTIWEEVFNKCQMRDNPENSFKLS